MRSILLTIFSFVIKIDICIVSIHADLIRQTTAIQRAPPGIDRLTSTIVNEGVGVNNVLVSYNPSELSDSSSTFFSKSNFSSKAFNPDDRFLFSLKIEYGLIPSLFS